MRVSLQVFDERGAATSDAVTHDDLVSAWRALDWLVKLGGYQFYIKKVERDGDAYTYACSDGTKVVAIELH